MEGPSTKITDSGINIRLANFYGIGQGIGSQHLYFTLLMVIVPFNYG